MNRRSFLVTVAATPLASARERALVAHWPLKQDAQDLSGNNLHGAARHVAFSPEGASFNGRDSIIEVPDAPALRLGTGDFTLSAHLFTEPDLDDVVGSIASQYDPATRRGLTLSVKDNCVTTAQSNHRNLHFGIDNGRHDQQWTPCGRPGNSVYDMALCVHRGELFAGTCEPGPGESGHVYRYAGDGRWIDCGRPDACNAISSLASWNGHLYAGSAKYRLAGSSLAESENPHLGGKVFRYEADGRWADCGKLGQSPAVACLTVFKGKLYASSLYAPAGTFRYEGGREWVDCGTPQGLRVEAMAVYNGHLFGTGYDKGQIYKYLGGREWAIVGTLPNTTQTYGFAIYQGRLYVSTWPGATVFRFEGDDRWTAVGKPGDEKESMALAVYNGKMYVGTLPLAEVHRYETEGRWTRMAQLDTTPNVRYRRAWSMAVFQGKLFCGTLPSGGVFSMEAGRNSTDDRELAPGWRHIAAVRAGNRLRLYVGGVEVAASSTFARADYDLTNKKPLLLGSGDHDHLLGRLRDVRLYRRALSIQEIGSLA
ncbi:MAG: LamG-like jellyroll fold domain-containing protein [Bryobacteraceae bacterium]